MWRLGGRASRVGHFSGAVVIRYARVFPFFTTSYGLPVQRPSKISLAFFIAATGVGLWFLRYRSLWSMASA